MINLSCSSFKLLEHLVKDKFNGKVFPPDGPGFLFVRIVQLLPGQELPVILDEVGVQPEEEGAVIVADRNPLGVAEKHELGVALYPGWRAEGHGE